MMVTFHDTICAVATANGGAIGVVRISGNEAIDIADKIFKPVDRRNTCLAERKAGTVSFGLITDSNGEVVDEVLASVFRAPHSYTGENSVEISCHGSAYILQRVMQLLIDSGCRGAEPGEYTQRAFLNGKMDLSQAEAVADLIASSSEATHRMAMNQLRGGLSKELTDLRDRLLHLTSLMELELDFSDHEELEFADRSELRDVSGQIEKTIERLVGSFKTGNAIKNGIPVAIIGETNVGKSTLLNALVGEEKAIVSDIHGTTRDVIEDTVNIDGVTFRFMDTAGIRNTDDKVEKIGIERTFEKISKAEIILLMVDATQPIDRIRVMTEQLPTMSENQQLVVVYNKTDMISNKDNIDDDRVEYVLDKYTATNDSYNIDNSNDILQSVLTHDESHVNITPQQIHEIFISAKYDINIDRLRNLLVSLTGVTAINTSDVIVTNVRHYHALSQALTAIRRVKEALNTQLPTDIISEDLRECLHHLADIVGEISSDMTLHNIFKNFCIGK